MEKRSPWWSVGKQPSRKDIIHVARAWTARSFTRRRVPAGQCSKKKTEQRFSKFFEEVQRPRSRTSSVSHVASTRPWLHRRGRDGAWRAFKTAFQHARTRVADAGQSGSCPARFLQRCQNRTTPSDLTCCADISRVTPLFRHSHDPIHPVLVRAFAADISGQDELSPFQDVSATEDCIEHMTYACSTPSWMTLVHQRPQQNFGQSGGGADTIPGNEKAARQKRTPDVSHCQHSLLAGFEGAVRAVNRSSEGFNVSFRLVKEGNERASCKARSHVTKSNQARCIESE